MEKSTMIKKYLMTTIIQIVVITIYVVSNFFAFKIERIVLEPVKYILPFAILLIAADTISLLLIFKNKKNGEENHE